MKLISLILLSFCLLGCASKNILLPIPIECPAPIIPEKPALPISELTMTSSQSAVIEAYIKTIHLLIIDNKDLRERLAAFKHEGRA